MALSYPGVPQAVSKPLMSGLQGWVLECVGVTGLSTGNLPAHMFCCNRLAVKMSCLVSSLSCGAAFPTCGFVQQRHLTRKHKVCQTIYASWFCTLMWKSTWGWCFGLKLNNFLFFYIGNTNKKWNLSTNVHFCKSSLHQCKQSSQTILWSFMRQELHFSSDKNPKEVGRIKKWGLF